MSWFFSRVLMLLNPKSTPNEIGPAAEIDDAPGEAFIHGHVRLAPKRVAGVETRAVAADAFLVSERLQKRLPERNPAILHRVMRIHFQVAFAPQFEVHHRVLGEEREHVVEERNASPDRGFAFAIDPQLELDLSFFGGAFELRLPEFHPAHTNRRAQVIQKQFSGSASILPPPAPALPQLA
jgi:hypothetical protein